MGIVSTVGYYVGFFPSYLAVEPTRVSITAPVRTTGASRNGNGNGNGGGNEGGSEGGGNGNGTNNQPEVSQYDLVSNMSSSFVLMNTTAIAPSSSSAVVASSVAIAPSSSSAVVASSVAPAQPDEEPTLPTVCETDCAGE